MAAYLRERGHSVVWLGRRGEDAEVTVAAAPAGEDKPWGASVDMAARGSLRGAVERSLGAGGRRVGAPVVIADACNEVKGFRYELYCAARAAGTTHAVLALRPPSEGLAMVSAWNAARATAGSGRWLAPAALEAAWPRFEAPDGGARWDSPLIEIEPDELASAVADGTPLPGFIASLAAVEAALFSRPGLKPVAATRPLPAAAPSYVHALDRATSAVAAHLTAAAARLPPGTEVSVPGCAEIFRARRRGGLKQADLRELRRRFIARAEAAPLPQEDIVRSFIVYLNLEEDAAVAAEDAAAAPGTKHSTAALEQALRS